MKGIVLAGGAGTRLYPITRAVSKQLLPIYDKPMIYYPISVLMLAGIRDVLIISTPQDLPRFQDLFGDGSQLGMNFSYVIQPRPEGLAQAFILGKEFLNGEPACLILGDNIFFGYNFQGLLKQCIQLSEGGFIFGYRVKDPERYGVVSFDRDGTVLDIEEKPDHPKSKYAVPGLYFFDKTVTDIASSLKPSPRGELEIVDVIRAYLSRKNLKVHLLGRGFSWLDTGTHESLQQASAYVEAIQARQGLKIACIEEIAFRQGFIDGESLEALAQPMLKNEYGQYLLEILRESREGTHS